MDLIFSSPGKRLGNKEQSQGRTPFSRNWGRRGSKRDKKKKGKCQESQEKPEEERTMLDAYNPGYMGG
jgi:hypothetical protein